MPPSQCFFQNQRPKMVFKSLFIFFFFCNRNPHIAPQKMKQKGDNTFNHLGHKKNKTEWGLQDLDDKIPGHVVLDMSIGVYHTRWYSFIWFLIIRLIFHLSKSIIKVALAKNITTGKKSLWAIGDNTWGQFGTVGPHPKSSTGWNHSI